MARVRRGPDAAGTCHDRLGLVLATVARDCGPAMAQLAHETAFAGDITAGSRERYETAVVSQGHTGRRAG